MFQAGATHSPPSLPVPLDKELREQQGLGQGQGQGQGQQQQRHQDAGAIPTPAVPQTSIPLAPSAPGYPVHAQAQMPLNMPGYVVQPQHPQQPRTPSGSAYGSQYSGYGGLTPRFGMSTTPTYAGSMTPRGMTSARPPVVQWGGHPGVYPQPVFQDPPATPRHEGVVRQQPLSQPQPQQAPYAVPFAPLGSAVPVSSPGLASAGTGGVTSLGGETDSLGGDDEAAPSPRQPQQQGIPAGPVRPAIVPKLNLAALSQPQPTSTPATKPATSSSSSSSAANPDNTTNSSSAPPPQIPSQSQSVRQLSPPQPKSPSAKQAAGPVSTEIPFTVLSGDDLDHLETKRVPSWAQGEALLNQLTAQARLNPETIFASAEHGPVNMAAIFGYDLTDPPPTAPRVLYHGSPVKQETFRSPYSAPQQLTPRLFMTPPQPPFIPHHHHHHMAGGPSPYRSPMPQNFYY